MPKKNVAKAPTAKTLLVELLTEELPPISLAHLGRTFTRSIYEGLVLHRFFAEGPIYDPSKVLVTPRRLAAVIPDVLSVQTEVPIERKLPVAAGIGPDGKPTQALLGFANSCGVTIEALERIKDTKGEFFVFRGIKAGEPLERVLTDIVQAALKKLPVAKAMRWGSGEAQFVRPVHGVVLLHGSKIVPGEILGLKSRKKTLGHRFLSSGWITIEHAANYEHTLRTRGKVIASFKERRESIVLELDKATKKLGRDFTWRLGSEDALVDEVAGIVENSFVYAGTFDTSFLEVPRECLILSMQKHQRHFPLIDANGKLLPRFLMVSNIQPTNPTEIIRGNERVLRARLADAKFFYDQDRKTKLADRVSRLEHVVYQNKLGSQLDRVKRIQKLAVAIASQVGAAHDLVKRAAELSKADLLTEMVGEFPELQGVMGQYYALHDGEDPNVATAILEHYLPRYAGDDLPRSQHSISVALADKLDTLVGIYGIGLVPTGEKDPFGLRRQALGVVRILVERKNLPSLDILELLRLSRECFPARSIAENVAHNLHAFLLERLKPYLRERAYSPDEIDAVLALNPTRLDEVLPRIEAIKKFRALPEGMALSAANKRIRNILRQAGGKIDGTVKSDLLTEEAEKKLAQVVGSASDDLAPMIARHDYSSALKRLASLRPTVDEFFDKVMVMADDSAVRANRLSLLNNLSNLFLHVADVSRLQG